jgi:hypothetical protein
MIDTQELIARLEAATGPDRELDFAIKAKVYGGVALVSPFNRNWCLYREGTTDPKTGRTLERPHNVEHSVWINDLYTASIDAALTLVPEGMQVSMGWPIGEGSDPEHAQAVLDRNPRLYGAAPTPALGLCIAALKARSQTDD